MRKPPRVALALLVLAAGGWAALRAFESGKGRVSTAFDVVYTRAGGEELKIDLARPAEGKGPFPAVVAIHGGGWAFGNKGEMRPLLMEFARRGYVAVAPQYRFSPKVTFPAQVHDVKAAVRWLKAHAGEYHADPDRVGAIGFSAGGHLALMLGLTGPGDGLEGDAPKDAPGTSVRAVVNFFGPTDLAADDFPEYTRNLVRDFLGGTPKEKPEAAAQASPVTYASKGDAAVLTFQGTGDALVPHSQAVRLADALTRAGAPGRVELLLGAGHGWQGEDLKRTLEETAAFFDKSLKK